MDQPRTRQELYDRIRRTSREEFLLEEMIRLGFWPAEGQIPDDPADEIRRKAEIRKEIDALRSENRKLHNEKALLKEMRKRRLEESNRKRRETKERRERERLERAEAWKLKQKQDIVFLGPRVSKGLGQVECDDERLTRHGLPKFGTASDIAAAMGITVGALRFLAFDRKTSSVSHYVRFQIPKKTGGLRLISAPKPHLKAAQEWILKNILEKVQPHDAAHGFRTARSIVTNAVPHLGAQVVVNLDLKDFFPTVGYRRVKGLFKHLGYSEAAATIFALVCTEPDVEQVELDGRTHFVALSGRHLPQGAPTSPALTNILCRRLDKRLAKLAEEKGFVYTRYADDLTFSASGDDLRNICNVLRQTEAVVAHEGFTVHPDKTRVLRKSRRQEVTGIVVNQAPNVPRDVLRRFRALLFQVEKDGPAGKRWGAAPDLFASMTGFANYVAMVNPVKGGELKNKVNTLAEKYGWKPAKPARPQAKPLEPPPRAVEPPSSAAKPEPEKKPEKWWKLW